MPGQIIRIMKVIERSDDTLELGTDNILVEDIKSFRKWHKKADKELAIEGDFCQLSIKSESGKNGFYTILINESEEAFGARLGNVIKL